MSCVFISCQFRYRKTDFKTDQLSMVVTTEETKLLGEIFHERHVSCN